MPASSSRRHFMQKTVATGATVIASTTAANQGIAVLAEAPTSAGVNAVAASLVPSPATTANRDKPWPVWDATEENAVKAVVNSGHWWRGSGAKVKEFEAVFGERMKAKHCLAVSSGTTALITSLGALGVGPGDEVIIPPYTFVATFNAVTQSYALPVFADSDIETFQVDPKSVAAAINSATKLLLPVHIGGTPADLDALMAIAKEHKLPLLEDACQAPLAEWRNQPVGSIGIGGCLSFQASKNLNSGEGGVVLTDDEAFYNLCYNFHTPGGGKPVKSVGRGANFRMTEFQAAMLLAQYTRVEEQSKRRDENAAYLTKLLAEIPGIAAVKLPPGCTRSAWHLFMMRYDSSQCGGLSRTDYLAKLTQAGVSASSGYSPLNKNPHVRALASNPHYQRIYGVDFMKKWLERSECPVNDKLCEEAVWLTQNMLLGTKSEIEQIADAFRNVQRKANATSSK